MDALDGRPAVVVVYEHGLHVIDVFSRPTPADDVGPRASSSRGFNIVFWRRHGFEFQAVSDLDAGELRRFVELFR